MKIESNHPGCDSYQTQMLPEKELHAAALALLAGFAGQPIAQIREVLRRAEFWLDATAQLDTGPSSEFQKAWSEFHGRS
ncbi:MAG: hypothetical protein LBO00_01125 [Zoogloeaceae bacterium]|nr:hypothetical protein [Zoogloeaceae bacterium]